MRATDLLQRGAELHDQGQCEAAVTLLESSWALEKSPMTATLLGECEVKLARWVPAARHLAAVLQDAEEGPERARLDVFFKQARAQVGGVLVQTNVDDADVFAGNELVGRTPLRAEVFVEPGDITITLKKRNVGEKQQVVRVLKGSSATIRLEPEALNRDSVTLSDDEPRSRIPAFVLAGVAIAAAGTGIGFRLMGSSQGAKADDELAAITTTAAPSPCLGTAHADACESIKDRRSKHDMFMNAGTGLFVLGGAALVASVTYALWPSPSSGKEHAVSVLPAFTPASGGVLVQGAF